jgi:hypothetical protein
MTCGLIYFPRMLDKIRLRSRGELHEDYHKNLGAVKAADGVCCNFLRIHYRDLRLLIAVPLSSLVDKGHETDK